MNDTTNHFPTSKYFLLALLIIDILFSLARLINLTADFPGGITTSGVLYTDEGWYSAAAIRHYLTGDWYLEGDINTAVTQPGGHILYHISFALFGLSLFSVRITIVTLFILLIILEAFWVRKYYGDLAALLTGLVISTNYLAFAYSRLALRFLIALFFMTASFWVVDRIQKKRGWLIVITASLLLAYAILTYATAIFAIPILLFLVWKNSKNRNVKFLHVLITCVVIITVVGGYMLVMRSLYPVDVANDTNTVRGSLITSFAAWPQNLASKMYSCFKNLGPDFMALTFLLTISAFVLSKKFRANPLVQVLIGFVVIYIALLSINTYGPPRYYLMLLLPFTGLCAAACTAIANYLREHNLLHYSFIPILLVVIVSVRGSWKIITYLAKPEYSFYEMAQGVKNIIQEREGTAKNVLLFGDIADSVSLEAGTNSVNNGMWTRSTVDVRLSQYHPKYLIVLTSNIEQVAVSLGGKVTELGRWDVFDNYYANGEQVRLYYVAWP